MTSDIAIDVQNVYKNFRIYHEKRNSIYDQISSTFNRKKHFEDFPILQDISFQVKKGEMFGIIGLNGSGKTTLLRLLAGIMKPNSGKIETTGKMVPLIALGTGFSPELTARDNIILNGMILGFTKKDIIGKIDAIIEFAELEKFVDTKLKNFSTGMHARLAFSIAMQVDPDILIVDEVLSVGDVPFQEKSFNAFMSFKKRGKTIVFVTHGLNQITRLCDRAIFLHNGRIHSTGKSNEVVNSFYRVVENKTQTDTGEIISISRRYGPQGISVNSLENMIYVSNLSADSVSVIDGETRKVIKNIPVSASPRDLVVNEKTNLIYVANRDANSLSVIDGKSHELVSTITVGEKPRGIAINENLNLIYVSHRDSNRIFVIDGNKNKVVNTISLPGSSLGLVIDDRTNQIFTTIPSSNSVVVIDGNHNKIIGHIIVSEFPIGMVIDKINDLLYVTNRDSDSVDVIDIKTIKVVQHIQVQNDPFGIVLNLKTGTIYVNNSGSNTVSIIDGSTQKVLSSINVGNLPLGISCNPRTNMIYTVSDSDDSITIINGKDHKVISTINLHADITPT